MVGDGFDVSDRVQSCSLSVAPEQGQKDNYWKRHP
jgi:hypothetical protein